MAIGSDIAPDVFLPVFEVLGMDVFFKRMIPVIEIVLGDDFIRVGIWTVHEACPMRDISCGYC